MSTPPESLVSVAWLNQANAELDNCRRLNAKLLAALRRISEGLEHCPRIEATEILNEVEE